MLMITFAPFMWIVCLQCSQKYESRCTPLTDAVDVYHDWLDTCEDANK